MIVLDCVHCNEETYVKDSVKKYGTVYRRRVCKVCGREFYTYEIEIEDENALKMCKDALTKRTSTKRRKNQ